MTQLEEESGVRFFDRSSGARKIVLTGEGVLLRRRAEEILELVDKTQHELQEQEGQHRRHRLRGARLILPYALRSGSPLARWFGQAMPGPVQPILPNDFGPTDRTELRWLGGGKAGERLPREKNLWPAENKHR